MSACNMTLHGRLFQTVGSETRKARLLISVHAYGARSMAAPSMIPDSGCLKVVEQVSTGRPTQETRWSGF